MLFPSFFYRSIKFIFLLICLIFTTTNCLFSQKIKVKATHTESVKTEDGYAKVIILDRSNNKLKAKESCIYFWFLNNDIHYSNGGYSGKLLHGTYTEYYANNNLKEKGQFNYGMKTGKWRKWYSNGVMKSCTEYCNGVKNRQYREYDEKGNLKISAKYKKGLLQGNYFLYSSGKPISKTFYRNGKEIIKKEKETKKNIPTKEKTEKKEKKCCFEKLFKEVAKKKSKETKIE